MDGSEIAAGFELGAALRTDGAAALRRRTPVRETWIVSKMAVAGRSRASVTEMNLPEEAARPIL